MATESETPSTGTTPAPEELKQQLASAISSADGAAVQSAANLKWVHQARVSRLTRTATALQVKYGANDPRVVQANAAVTDSTQAAAKISIANQQMATPAPQVPAGGWVLHGRVFDSQLKPVAKQTVFLVDQTNAYQKQIGFAYTDDTGYFAITYAVAQAPATPNLFVQVADANARPVFLSKTAFQPAANSVAYQNIALSATGPIGDPPAELRADAFPNTKQ